MHSEYGEHHERATTGAPKMRPVPALLSRRPRRRGQCALVALPSMSNRILRRRPRPQAGRTLGPSTRPACALNTRPDFVPRRGPCAERARPSVSETTRADSPPRATPTPFPTRRDALMNVQPRHPVLCNETRQRRHGYQLRCDERAGHEGDHRWTPELVGARRETSHRRDAS
jgi:hypothetical protein